MNSNLSTLEESHCSWKTIIIHDEKFSIRAVERDGNWKVFLTNLRDIWTESLGPKEIVEKCERLNPSLSIEDIDVVQFVRRLLGNIHRTAVKKSVERIEFAEDLEGGVFKFAVDFKRGSCQEFWEQVTMPLCLMAGELQRRQAILLDLVKKKDEEIIEYKLNGAELIRKHIETKPFSEVSFKKNAPKCNAESSVSTFENVMKLRADFDLFINVEPTLLCMTEGKDNSEKSIDVEEKIVADSKNVNPATTNRVSEVFEGTSENRAQESSIIPPKIEIAEVPKLSKKTKNSHHDEHRAPKKARSAPSLSAKRTKKTIDDFIT